MTKLYEVDVELGWQNLNTLAGVTLSGEYELWNAGREHDVVNIFYTESENEPTDESFYKTLPRQNKVIIEIGEQPIWVKSEVKSAKLIISTSVAEDVELTGDSLTAINTIKDDVAATNTILSSTDIGSGIGKSIYNAMTNGMFATVWSNVMGIYGAVNGGVLSVLTAIANRMAKKGTVSTALSDISVTTTSSIIDCTNYNAVLISTLITGTGTWNVKIQGNLAFDGTFMDMYDNNGNLLTTGNTSANLIKLCTAIPDFIQVVATEVVDGATLTVRIQPINV